MIVSSDEPSFDCVLDVGRPNMYTHEELERWLKFHEIVESTTIPMKVNSRFRSLYAEIKEGQRSIGGGMKCCFWFKTEEDKNQFDKVTMKIWRT